MSTTRFHNENESSALIGIVDGENYVKITLKSAFVLQFSLSKHLCYVHSCKSQRTFYRPKCTECRLSV